MSDAPPPLTPPVPAVVVVQEFRLDPARPYAAGSRRAIALRGGAGSTLAAPCDGVVTFSGTVAGRPASITVRCAGGWRVTLGGLRAATAQGREVRAGVAVARARGELVTLSLRSPAGAYLDPGPQLRTGSRTQPPLGAAGRTGKESRPARWRPAELPRSSLVEPATRPTRAAAATPAVGAPRASTELPYLPLAGGFLAALLITMWRRAGSLSAAWPATSPRRSST